MIAPRMKPAKTRLMYSLFVQAQLNVVAANAFRVSLFIQSITIYLIRQNAKKLDNHVLIRILTMILFCGNIIASCSFFLCREHSKVYDMPMKCHLSDPTVLSFYYTLVSRFIVGPFWPIAAILMSVCLTKIIPPVVALIAIDMIYHLGRKRSCHV